MAGLTALQALRDQGELAAGEKVLINGAAGGVGHLAVQIAVALGARVTGSRAAATSTSSAPWAPARRSTTRRRTSPAATAPGTSSSTPSATAPTRTASRRCPRDGGIYVTTGVGPRPFLNAVFTELGGLFGQKKRARWIMAKPNAADLTLLARLVDQGRLRPEIQEVFPLEEIARAHDLSETGRVRGKLVVRVN